MVHHMKLQPEPFKMIKNGQKTIELRLNDEKRRMIQMGDVIVFSMMGNPTEEIVAEVTKLHVFANFDELYASLPLEKCGYLPEQVCDASAHDMCIYYSKEQQNEYGVLGIELKVLSQIKL